MNTRKLMLAASAAAFALTAAPAMAERGTDGDLKIIFWQAVSTMNG